MDLTDLIPVKRPLQPYWLSRVCPACGKKGGWSDWSADSQDIISCSACNESFPNKKYSETKSDKVGEFEYRYYVSRDGNKYYFSDVIAGNKFDIGISALCGAPSLDLAHAFLLTGAEKYAEPMIQVAMRLAEVYPGYFLLNTRESPSYNNGKGGGVSASDFPEASYGYHSKTMFWGDATLLSHALTAMDVVRFSKLMTPDKFAFIRDGYVKEALETFVVNKLYYTLNKFHNSHGNYYLCMVLAGRLFGRDLTVRDRHGSEFVLSGPDLVHEAVDGPKGMRYFFDNAYGPDGIYFEHTYSYHNHAMKVMVPALLAVRGYTDPERYKPSEWCAPRHRRYRNLNPGRAIPRLLKAMSAYDKLLMPDFRCVSDNDSFGDIMASVSAHRYIAAWLLTGSRAAAETARTILDRTKGREFTEEFISDIYFFNNYFLYGGTLPEASSGAGLKLCSEILPSGFSAIRAGADFSLHMSWDQLRQFHSHADHLAVQLFAEGKEMLVDLGYMGSGHRMRHLWMNRTIAHNTVTVDRHTPEEHFCSTPGKPLMFGSAGGVSVVDAEAPGMYEQTSEYRRLCAYIDVGGGCYLMDFFDVTGGAKHDYSLLAGTDKCRVQRGRFKKIKGTLAGKNSKYDADAIEMRTDGRTSENGYRFVHDLQSANLNAVNSCAELTWDFDDETKLNAFVIGRPGMKAVAGKYPVFRGHRWSRDENSLREGRMLVVRNANPGVCESAFATVLEPFRNERTVKNINCPVNDWSGHVVEVVHESGTDLIMKRAANAWRVTYGAYATNARLAVIRRTGSGALLEISLFGELSIDLPEMSVHAAKTTPVGVAGCDPREGRITLNAGLPQGNILKGEMCLLERGSSNVMFKIKRVDEKSVQLDTDHSGMIYLRGTISKILSPSTFLTATPLNTDIAHGDLMLVGEKRFRVQSFERTSSDPDDFGVYPVNDIYSARIKLEKDELTDNDFGRDFEVSKAVKGGLFSCPVRASISARNRRLVIMTNAPFSAGLNPDFMNEFDDILAKSHSGVPLNVSLARDGTACMFKVECRAP